MLLVFDWDGTLADSQAHIVSAMQQTIDDLSLAPRSDRDCASCIGLGLYETAIRLYPDLDPNQLSAFRANYSKNYVQLGQSQFNLTLFEGVFATLQRLQGAGHVLAVATGKSRAGLDRVFAQTQIAEFFSYSRTADETASKPDPKMLSELLEESRFGVDQAIMIGDSSFDLEMAESIQMRRVGVSYGVHDRETLRKYNPLAIIDHISELPDLLADS